MSKEERIAFFLERYIGFTECQKTKRFICFENITEGFDSDFLSLEQTERIEDLLKAKIVQATFTVNSLHYGLNQYTHTYVFRWDEE